MKRFAPWQKGLAVGGLHVALLAGIGGKFLWDRRVLPHGWVKTASYDPDMPLRGRYVQLRLIPARPLSMLLLADDWSDSPVELQVENGEITARPSSRPKAVTLTKQSSPDKWAWREPIVFFLPEHVPDPSVRAAGEELWVEVSLPPHGPPRPRRLGVKKEGTLTPLELR